MEKLDLRLEAAASFVRKNTVAADVGTDHGYLVCDLVNEGICTNGYATDINIKPLESAKALIKELGLEEKIKTVLTDGLIGLPEKEIDEIIICGMGGETISGILSAVGWIKNEKKHLILQPMSKADVLRDYLCKNGWTINDEKAVEVDKHLYTIISAYYKGFAANPDRYYCITGELSNSCDKYAVKYMRWQANIQKEIATGLMRSEHEKERALRYIALANMIDKRADEMETENEKNH